MSADNGAPQQNQQPATETAASKPAVFRDDVPEKIMAPGGSGGWVAPIRDSQTARTLAERRWDKYRKSATAGMVAAAVSTGASLSSPLAAYGAIVERQTELALSPDLRGSTAAASFVAKAIDAMPRRDANAAPAQGGARFTLDLDDAAIGRLLDTLAELRKQGQT